ncbi:DUF3885 domain-containing protein [Streptomyces sp. NPDC004393]
MGYKLRDPYWDVWVPFHSLPESKRYAEDESEYGVVVERYNTVLDELFAGADVYVITPLWTTEAEVPSLQSVTGYCRACWWRTILTLSSARTATSSPSVGPGSVAASTSHSETSPTTR